MKDPRFPEEREDGHGQPLSSLGAHVVCGLQQLLIDQIRPPPSKRFVDPCLFAPGSLRISQAMDLRQPVSLIAWHSYGEDRRGRLPAVIPGVWGLEPLAARAALDRVEHGAAESIIWVLVNP